MVLTKRSLGAVHKFNNFNVPGNVPPDHTLDVISQQTMTGMLEQLYYLTAFSAELFNDILKDTHKTAARILTLGQRTDQIAATLPAVEQFINASQADNFLANPKAAFRAKRGEQMQHLTKNTIPASLLDIYNRECQPPPNLSILNPLRDDGKDSLKEYSNPSFFIDEWIAEQKKQQEEAKKKRDERRAAKQAQGGNKRNVTEKREVRKVELARAKYDPTGLSGPSAPAATSQPAGRQARPMSKPPSQAVVSASANAYANVHEEAPAPKPVPARTQAPPQQAPAQQAHSQPAPSSHSSSSKSHHKEKKEKKGKDKKADSKSSHSSSAAAPSPRKSQHPSSTSKPSSTPAPAAPAPTNAPPPMSNPYSNMNAPPAMNAPPVASAYTPTGDEDQGEEEQQEEYAAPPSFAPPAAAPPPPGPPPPGPPPPKAAPPPPGPPGPPGPPPAKGPAAPVNVKSNLLQQIQQGMALKKGQEREIATEAPKPAGGGDQPGFDVEKILARRAALADSDDEEDDDGDWD